MPPNSVDDQWDLTGLERELAEEMALSLPVTAWPKEAEELDAEAIERRVQEAMDRHFEDKEKVIGGETMRALEKHIMLTVLDKNWKEHLARMDYLRQGIHLRGYAQKQPKQEYKREAFELFGAMLDSIKREVTRHLLGVRVQSQEEVEAAERKAAEEAARAVRNVQYQHADFQPGVGDEAAEQIPPQGALATAPPPQNVEPFVRSTQKVGRNDPCPCGSGKKYKQCHGKLA